MRCGLPHLINKTVWPHNYQGKVFDYSIVQVSITSFNASTNWGKAITFWYVTPDHLQNQDYPSMEKRTVHQNLARITTFVRVLNIFCISPFVVRGLEAWWNVITKAIFFINNRSLLMLNLYPEHKARHCFNSKPRHWTWNIFINARIWAANAPVALGLSILGRIMIPMCKLWLHDLYGLHESQWP